MQSPYTLIHPGAREKSPPIEHFSERQKTGFASVEIGPENAAPTLT
jgi:hypothetical protein